MGSPHKVTAYLKVTAEFYDPEATPETVRACVEQDLEDAGYEVDVDCVFPDEETFCQYMARNYFPPNADREKVIDMNGKLALDYLEKCWKEYFDKDNSVPCKSDVPDTNAGKWTTERTQEHDGEWYCSECGYEPVVMSDDMKYCPGCGRKMTMPEPPKEGT